MKFSLALISATAAIASPIVISNKWKRQNVEGQDFEIVNLARNLESLELNYWAQGLQNFTAEDFNNAGFNGFYDFLSIFRDQEVAHFTALNEAAGGQFENCTYIFPVSTPEEFITLGQVVTSVGEGAFLGGLGNLTSPAIRQQAGQIIGNEARQNSYLRQSLGLTFFNAPNFDTPLTASEAYSLAAPFLSCPDSNAPINFALIPELQAVFADAAPANETQPAKRQDQPQTAEGDREINISWNAQNATIQDGVTIRFLSDVMQVSAPLQIAGEGQGTTTLPAGLNGTVFLVASNFQGEGPVPDGQALGVGYIVAT